MRGLFLFCSAALLCFSQVAMGQGMAVNTSGAAADGSAMLDVSSTSKGMLVPRMTTAQRTAIGTPAQGLLVYQTDGTTPGFYYYNGTAWGALSGGSSSGSSTNTPSFSFLTTLGSGNTLGNGTNYLTGTGLTATESGAARVLPFACSTVILAAIADGVASPSFTFNVRQGLYSSTSGTYTYSDIPGASITVSGIAPQIVTITGLSLPAGSTLDIREVGTASFNAEGRNLSVSLTGY